MSETTKEPGAHEGPRCTRCGHTALRHLDFVQTADCMDCDCPAFTTQAPLPPAPADEKAPDESRGPSWTTTSRGGQVARPTPPLADPFLSFVEGRPEQVKANVGETSALSMHDTDEMSVDAARYRFLRDTLHAAKGGAGVEVNDALGVYEQPTPGEEVRVYWYPDTPVGFCESKASTLDAAIDAAMQSAALSPSPRAPEGETPR